jgi:hypothetical protein
MALQKGIALAALQKVLNPGRLGITAIYLNLTDRPVVDKYDHTTSITIEVKFCCSLRVLRQLYTFSAV